MRAMDHPVNAHLVACVDLLPVAEVFADVFRELRACQSRVDELRDDATSGQPWMEAV